MHLQGCSYSAINTAKAALQTVVKVNDSQNWGQQQDVVRLLKGIYCSKPPTPKYSFTWDSDKLVNYLQLLTPNDKLTLKEITFKTLGLIALTTGARAQSMHLLDIANMKKTKECYKFVITSRIKTTKPGKSQPIITIRKFSNPTCCTYTTLEDYLHRTHDIRAGTQLWVSYIKPFKEVTKQTLSRWLKELLNLAGIDTLCFTGHSTRMASSSKVNAMGIGLDTILKTAGWDSSTNFNKFYRRETSHDETGAFAEAVLTTKSS